MITNQDITHVAFRLFASKGFHETTTENIAQVLGLKKQSLYSHFKNKNEIILAVLREQSRNISNEIDVIIAEYRNKSIEMLLKFIYVRISIYFSQRERLLFWKRIFHLEIHGEYAEIFQDTEWQFDRKLHAELQGILSTRYQQFQIPSKQRSFFMSYMLFIHGYLDWMLVSGFDINTAETSWENFWNGVQSMF